MDGSTSAMVIAAFALGVDQPEFAVMQLHGEVLALDGFQLDHAAMHLGLGHQLLGGVDAGHHVVGQDLGQIGLVLGLDQGIDGAGRQRGEGFVGRREDGEGTAAVEGVEQARRLDRSYQSGVVLGVDGLTPQPSEGRRAMSPQYQRTNAFAIAITVVRL